MPKIAGATSHPDVSGKAFIKGNSNPHVIGGFIDSGTLDPAHTGFTHIIRAGNIIGKNSNTGRWHVIRGGYTAGATNVGTTKVVLASATLINSGDNVKIVPFDGASPEQDLGAVTAKSGGALTVTNALSVTVAQSAWVCASPATDYDQDVAAGILMTDVTLKNEYGAAVHAMGDIADALAVIDSSEVRNLYGKAQEELEGPPHFFSFD